jgi:xanthosine utilization system XapX-like protein
VTLRSVIKISQRFIIDNSPTLLSGVAVTGTLAVAYLTGKATFKASELLEEEAARVADFEPAVRPSFNNKDKVKLTWTCYIPPALAVVGTVGCIVGANHINAKRMAALAAAYKISERQWNQYKDKVKEIIGDKQEGEIRTSIAQDLVDGNAIPDNIINALGGETLCFDKWTGRYFRSDMQTIRAAENDIVKGMYRGKGDVATLADFYNNIGLPAPRCADEVGWNSDTGMELTFTSVIANGDVPCLVMDFAIEPFPIRTYFGHP